MKNIVFIGALMLVLSTVIALKISKDTQDSVRHIQSDTTAIAERATRLVEKQIKGNSVLNVGDIYKLPNYSTDCMFNADVMVVVSAKETNKKDDVELIGPKITWSDPPYSNYSFLVVNSDVSHPIRESIKEFERGCEFGREIKFIELCKDDKNVQVFEYKISINPLQTEDIKSKCNENNYIYRFNPND